MSANRSQWICPPGPVADGLRIGLLGGSFNPAHQGHIHISETALKALALDYVWWLVSPQNPLKSPKGMASLEERYSSARQIAHQRRIIVTTIESDFGTAYTVDTLSLLAQRFPAVRFVWLMGSDNLLQMKRWKDWRQIFSLVPIAVIARPGTALAARTSDPVQVFGQFRHDAAHLANAKPPAWTILDARRNAESATRLRAKGLG